MFQCTEQRRQRDNEPLLPPVLDMDDDCASFVPADGQSSHDVFFLRVKAQLLFPHTGILRALWTFQYKWHAERHALRRYDARVEVRLHSVRYHRLNAHEGYIDYVYGVCSSNDAKSSTALEPTTNGIRFRDIDFRVIDQATGNKTHRQLATEREKRRSIFLDHLLVSRIAANDNDDHLATSSSTSHYFFWRDKQWWREQSKRLPELLKFAPTASTFNSRAVRLLNLLTRTLLVRRRADSIEQALTILSRAVDQHVDLLQKLYVEPTASSLFAAYLSTTFMHHKQQHGLNTKHAAGAGEDCNMSAEARRYTSKTKFDQKIYLDMCSSCDKKEIFEIMLKMPTSEHTVPPPCPCDICRHLTEMANAWRYYDCTDRIWLRLEFNRRMYNSVSLLISQHSQFVRIVFFSYKNEFYEREKFIANFVNYYAFYENNEQPVNETDLHGPLREKISIIFVFAVVNWKLISNTINAKKMHNSISLNQQSIFKSLDNTLYAVFSENSINRMAKETKQRVLDINAPYINRGFGSLPNCGVNAFTTTIDQGK